MAVIELFADIVCPFAYVGLTRLVAERGARGREDVAIVVRSWPLEWVNGAPMEGDGVAAKGEVLAASVAPGLFGGVRPDHFPTTTIPALALTAEAYRRGAADGLEVALGLRRALFEDGLDIGDPAVLATFAAARGLTVPADDDAVRADYEEGKRREVKGSPHLFAPDGTNAFCPALSITRPDGQLHVEFDRARFDAFAAHCFAPPSAG